jgi:primosomal protein N'
MEDFMSFSDNVVFCSECGKVEESPICCGQEMELDKDIIFCNICGKERKLPVCCGKDMVIVTKESLKGVLT